jgi:DNA repair protein RecO (recombination protein O)
MQEGTLGGPAVVLHARRYRDSSLLLDLLLREHGRVACIARGALRARRAGGRLQPFQRMTVDVRGRGEVLTLLNAEPDGSPMVLAGRRLYCGLYLNELIQRLTARHDPAPGLFDDYVVALARLGDPGAEDELALRWFELRLLDHIGVGLVLDQDTDGRPVDPSTRYTYRPDSGAPQRETLAAPAGLSVDGATLLALQRNVFADTEQRRAARRFMRCVINGHLEGRPLKSRELFRHRSQ